jgi:hypothetical protein
LSTSITAHAFTGPLYIIYTLYIAFASKEKRKFEIVESSIHPKTISETRDNFSQIHTIVVIDNAVVLVIYFAGNRARPCLHPGTTCHRAGMPQLQDLLRFDQR